LPTQLRVRRELDQNAQHGRYDVVRHGRDQELQALEPREWVARLLLLGRLMRSSMRHQASANAVKRILSGFAALLIRATWSMT
jgi:hypothetical protein